MPHTPPTPESLHPNLAELLWRDADAHGDRPVIIERDRTTSYASLRARAAAVAGALAAQGVAPGDRVAVLLERGPDAAAAFFGGLAAGAILININETLRPRQIEHVLAHAGVSVLITHPELIAQLPRALATEARIVDVGSIPAEGDFRPVRRTGDDPAQISYTSGSTGAPKGVVLSHRNLWSVTHAVVSYLELTESDRIASLLPFSFVYGFNQMLCVLGAGATLVIERSPLPQNVVASLRAHEVSVLAAVPPLWAQLLGVKTFAHEPIPSLRVLTNAGGGIAPELVRRVRAAQPHAKLYLMYGLTEALRSTYLPPDEVDAHPNTIGRAMPGTDIFVLDEDGRQCRVGEVGELVQRGPTVALGYWNDPEATARVFTPNPLRPAGTPDRERVVHSGDLVRVGEDGLFFYVGRRDHMIKTLGYRVSPDEICNVLYASGLVAQAVVTSEPDAQRGQRIVAVVALKPDATLPALDRFCKMELPRYMQPARFDVREELPRLPSGKFDIPTIRREVAGSGA